MFTLKGCVGGTLFVLVLAGASLAQENRAPIETPREPVAPVPSAPLVTATATAERVRFVSPGTVVQLRLEVYNETGQKLFDTELHGGNVLDWHLQDGAGGRLPAGSYACVLTIKSLSGRLSQRVGLVTVAGKKAAVEAAGTAELSQLSLAQQQVIGPVEGNAVFTVLQPSEAEAITTVTHDGADGQMTRTRGALSFRMGDFFSGKDSEQMRLTEEGNLGIGTSEPQAKLDVAGLIRAREGLMFSDGSTLKVNEKGALTRSNASGEIVPNIAGAGTQNKLAKWTDNSGTLADSNVTEAASGKVGIGTATPNYEITLFGNDVGLQLISPLTGVTANDGFRFGISSTNNAFLWNTEATDMYFGTSATERMRITAAGNVGIGTNNPTTLLDVAGKINTSTEYHIGGSRVLSVAGSDNTFAGVNAGFQNTTGSRNSFFGKAAGRFNTSGRRNSFFGESAGLNNTTAEDNVFVGANAGRVNTTGSDNVFVGSSAGANNTTGFGNSFFGAAAGTTNVTGSNNTLIGRGTSLSVNVSFATAIGSGASANQSNRIVLGRINGQDEVFIPGTLLLANLATGGSTQVCRAGVTIAVCSSSLRYKTHLNPYFGGLDVVRRLRPIAFNWKDGGMKDVGFAAEEVEKIEPLLTTRNDKGEIEGVKYAQVTTVLVNAVNEQQAQIEKQARQIEVQRKQIDALKKFVCQQNPRAAVCREK